MDRYVDMHCHIIPGVDDGAADMEEAVKMLQTAYKEGIRLIIATPHYHPRRGHESLEVIQEQLRMLREEAAKIDEKFRIYLGREIYYGQDIPGLITQGRTGTMNERNVVLLEFSPADSFEYIRQGVQNIQMTGNEVILAHAERYQCLTDNVELAEKLYDMGVNIQINADSITGNAGRKIKKFIKELAKRDIIFGIGTDAHENEKRAPRMKKAAEYIKRKFGEDYMRRIFFDNPAGLLKKKKEV